MDVYFHEKLYCQMSSHTYQLHYNPHTTAKGRSTAKHSRVLPHPTAVRDVLLALVVDVHLAHLAPQPLAEGSWKRRDGRVIKAREIGGGGWWQGE